MAKWFLKGFSWKEFKGSTNMEGFSSKYHTKLLVKILRYFLPDQDPMIFYQNYPEEENSDFNSTNSTNKEDEGLSLQDVFKLNAQTELPQKTATEKKGTKTILILKALGMG